MAFFYPRTVYHPETSFTPVFRLLNRRSSSQCQPRSNRSEFYVCTPQARPWVPKFQAKETDDAYVIFGHLPDMTKDQISVEFPESQKLVIRGTTERQAQPTIDAAPETTPAATSDDVDDVSSVATEASEEAKSVRSYQATVEDADDNDFEIVDKALQTPKEQPQLESEQAGPEPKKSSSPASQPEKKPEPAKYESRPAQSERRVRRFARTLNFPAEVELDHGAVTADLKDGILRIIVPKARRPEPRRIAIF